MNLHFLTLTICHFYNEIIVNIIWLIFLWDTSAARHVSTKNTKYPEYFTLIFHRNPFIPNV